MTIFKGKKEARQMLHKSTSKTVPVSIFMMAGVLKQNDKITNNKYPLSIEFDLVVGYSTHDN